MISRDPADTVRAVLGPTNTGKTYLAVERMLGYPTGMIGFPLRLLARENYDRIVAKEGRASVALITGEEKIVPANPRWFVCTVEAMPMEKSVDFLAVDEIQLCGDPDRGHVFTDRLLNARGRMETMFLGAESMAGLIRRLVPHVRIESRPRFSTLSYIGGSKLTRLPRRSAIVAFSVNQVYRLAEALRHQRGGTAVVLGALSPRTRNAQVAMYQEGEVDYLVATDAIGMGLNMDVDHVAFAALRKFDGLRQRLLTPPEMGQIAGRAGRHMNDGTFGVTNDQDPPDEETIRQVEEHDYPALDALHWRSRSLDFASPRRLYASLNAKPPRVELIQGREADDQLALGTCMQDTDVLARCGTRDRVQLLWDCCQIPDFRKVMPDHHAALIARIFVNLVDCNGQLPADWVSKQIEGLMRTDGDIDTLMSRLAHIRTWTYITHRGDWIADAAHWQARARDIEDKLSDLLHNRLMERFVDRRAAALLRKKSEALTAADTPVVTTKGDVVVAGHVIGRMEGLSFHPHDAADRREEKALKAAASDALQIDAPYRVKRLEDAPDQSFGMTPAGKITWDGREIARIAKGDDLLSPRAVLLSHDLKDSALAERARRRVQAFLDRFLARRLGVLTDPKPLEKSLDAAGRGLVFQLREGLGTQRRKTVAAALDALSSEARKVLSDAGLRIGRDWVYLAPLLDPKSVRARAICICAEREADLPETPNRSAPVLDAALFEREIWPTLGYTAIGPYALRVDRYERVAAMLRRTDRQTPVPAEAVRNLLSEPLEDAALEALMRGFGYKRDEPLQSEKEELSAEDALVFLPVSRRKKSRKAVAGKGTKKGVQKPRKAPEGTDAERRAGAGKSAPQERNRAGQNRAGQNRAGQSKDRSRRAAYNPDSPFAVLKDMLPKDNADRRKKLAQKKAGASKKVATSKKTGGSKKADSTKKADDIKGTAAAGEAGEVKRAGRR